MNFILLSLAFAIAHAQEAPANEPAETPQTTPESSQTPTQPVTPAPKARVPTPGPKFGDAHPTLALTPERLTALRQYRARQLSVRGETELHGGGTRVSSFSSYPYSWGMHTTVVSDPISTTRTWGLYQGPRRLSAPEFLLLAEETERHQQLVTAIHLAERKSKRWFRVAGVGAAGIITGMVGMAVADEMEPYLLWNRVTFGSSTVAVAGLLGASFPSAKANRLQRDPSASFAIEQAHQWTDGHNEELRVELGLSPEEVWLLEMGTEGR